jgi:hypothetical protein
LFAKIYYIYYLFFAKKKTELHPVDGLETKNVKALTQDFSGEFAKEKPTPFLWTAFDSAIAEKSIEFFSELVKIISKSVGQEIPRHQFQNLSEAANMNPERYFRRMLDSDPMQLHDFVHIGTGLSFDPVDPHIGV